MDIGLGGARFGGGDGATFFGSGGGGCGFGFSTGGATLGAFAACSAIHFARLSSKSRLRSRSAACLASRAARRRRRISVGSFAFCEDEPSLGVPS